MKNSIFVMIAIFGVAACGGQQPTEISGAAETDLVDNFPSQDAGLVFAQDGDTIRLNVGQEISVKLDLPEGITNTSISWQPVEGWYDGSIEEFRTYHSLEGETYYTDLQIRGIEPGQKTLTLAPTRQRQPAHEERRTLTFVVE